jgi:hypothetical protein
MQSSHPVGNGQPSSPSRDRTRAGERLIAVFWLGIALFSPLLLSLFDQGMHTRVLGLPLLYLYLFGAWGTIIGLLAWAVERSSGEDDNGDPDAAGGGR